MKKISYQDKLLIYIVKMASTQVIGDGINPLPEQNTKFKYHKPSTDFKVLTTKQREKELDQKIKQLQQENRLRPQVGAQDERQPPWQLDEERAVRAGTLCKGAQIQHPP